MQRRTPIFIVCFILLPPLLFFLYTIVSAVLTYNGICTGVLGTQPHTCSIGEFIGRNTLTATHAVVSAAWVTFAAGLLILVVLIRRAAARRA